MLAEEFSKDWRLAHCPAAEKAIVPVVLLAESYTVTVQLLLATKVVQSSRKRIPEWEPTPINRVRVSAAPLAGVSFIT